jgi:rhamnulokinase
LIDARSRQWSENTIDRLGLPAQLFGDIVLPGTARGKLKENIAKELGLDTIDVIAVGSHDTASAVAATPFAEVKT